MTKIYLKDCQDGVFIGDDYYQDESEIFDCLLNYDIEDMPSEAYKAIPIILTRGLSIYDYVADHLYEKLNSSYDDYPPYNMGKIKFLCEELQNIIEDLTNNLFYEPTNEIVDITKIKNEVIEYLKVN